MHLIQLATFSKGRISKRRHKMDEVGEVRLPVLVTVVCRRCSDERRAVGKVAARQISPPQPFP